MLSWQFFFSVSTLLAHDFEAVNEDGVTIYFNIISTTEKTCEVTYRGTSYYAYTNEYLGAVKIPETVTYSSIDFKVTAIGISAFDGCSGLTSVSIPDFITSIGQRAFSSCTSLTKLSIPNSVTSIGGAVFQGCTGLVSMIIPNSVTSIESLAFTGCKNLTTVTLGNSIKSIGHHAFNGCNSLTSVTIPNSVTRIDDEVFYECTGLKFITIGNSVTSIGNYTFYDCIGLTSIEIPNSVTKIGENAFYKCTSLNSVTIGNSVRSIGAKAFSGCLKLSEIISKIDNPNNISSTCFEGLVKLNATLYVPKGKKEIYQAKTGWDFVNIDDGLVYHQLTLIGNEGGVITFNGKTIENSSVSFDVREGNSATITLEPYEKYKLISLKMNGINVKKYMEGNTFTTDEIDGDVEIVATFDLIDPYLTITPTNKLQTFCSDENLNFSEVNGLTAYIVVGYKPSAKEVLLTPAIEVPAGTGVLLKGEVGETYKVPTMENSDYNYSNALVGVLEEKEVTTGFVFDETFKAVDGSAVVPANTAYLLVPAATEAGITELTSYLTDGPAIKGDMNGDGRADISDVVYLVNLILGQ